MSFFSQFRKKRYSRGKTPGYDAGGWDRRNENWSPVSGTAEEINKVSRDTLRSRARDLERNADHVEALILAYERNVVGRGIHLQSKINRDEEETYTALQAQIEELWQIWCKPEYADITGRQCFKEMQKMAVRRMVVDGGALFLLSYTGNREFPLQLQMKEVDDLDSTVLFCGKNKVVDGLELNENGRILAYHFKVYDPFGWTGESVRVNAEQVIFLQMLKRPSQIREISNLSNTMPRLKDLNQYLDAVSTKEKVLACLAVFIKKVRPSIGLGWPAEKETDQETKLKKRKLAPGIIQELEEGEEVQVVNPSGQASNAKDLITTMTRSASAAQGLSYEAVSRDMSESTYSSARQNLLEDRETYKQWQDYLIEHLCERVYEKWLESCVLAGTIPIQDFFSSRRKYSRCRFIANGMSWIDPVKEVNANRVALETCQITLEQICAEQGMDYKEVMKQRSIEIKLAEKLGLRKEKELEAKENRRDPKPADDADGASGGGGK